MDEPPAEATPPEEPQPPSGGARSDWTGVARRVAAKGGPDLVFIIASVLFVLTSFLPWYRLSVGRLSFTNSAWNLGGLGILAALFGLAAAAVTLLVTAGSWRISRVSAALLSIVLATGTLFFTFLRLAIEPGPDVERATFGVVKLTRGFGLWIGTLLAIVMLVAALWKLRAGVET